MIEQELAEPPTDIRRVAFLGTPPAAVPSLEALVSAGYEVPVVVSQPDRRRGRGSKLISSPVKKAALNLGLNVDDDANVLLSVENLDLAVVVAYGQILTRRLLEAVPMVNVHFSLLPRWRGAAPVERAILAGDRQSGVSIMRVAEGLDEGPVYSTSAVDIGFHESAGELTERLSSLGAELLISTIGGGLTDPVPQLGESTYARKLSRAEAELDFTQSAIDLHRRVRIGRSWTTFRAARLGIEKAVPLNRAASPGALELLEADDVEPDVEPDVETLADGASISGPVVSVGAGEQSLALVSVKPEGRRTMHAADWWNGAQPEIGEQLGT